MRAAKHPKLRTDLSWRRFASEGTDSYIFKDEISQEYVKLDEITGALALRLDGKTSREELLAFAQEHWPGLEFDLDYIADVIADLEGYKFIDDPFQRNALLRARAHAERAQINASMFKNLFAIPLGTVNPDRFLNRTYPYLRWFFSPVCVGIGLALSVAAAYIAVVNQHLAAQQTALLVPGGINPLAVVLGWVTVVLATTLHELGHAYAVKHYGGKVQELGFMAITVMPCMYCDTSDSHLFPNWKHRAGVALAGTYVDVYMASLATVVWWATPPGMVVNHLAYSVMLFSGVRGILFNANVLMKLDGYFVLADVLDMPNLQEDAFAYLGYLFKRYVLRMRNEPCPAEGRRRKRVLAIYGVSSVVFSIVFPLIAFTWLRALLLQSFGFAGAVIAAALLAGLLWGLGRPVQTAAHAWALDHRGLIRRQQALILALVVGLLGVFLLLPVPGRQAIRISLEPIREVALTAPEDLRVVRADWSAGQAVAAGEVLAVLDADVAAARHGEAVAAEGALRIAGATARRSGTAGEAITAQAGMIAERERSALLERRARRAELKAPFAGRVLTAATPGWVGGRVEAGDTLCVVGDFSRVRATARLHEFDVGDVRVGAPVRIRLSAHPGHVLQGRVSAIQPAAERRGGMRVFRVQIALAEAPGEARAGLTGRAWLATPARPPADHLRRFLARFVRLDLWV